MDLGRILRGQHVPWGFLGMLALVLLCEATIRLNRTTFTSYNALTWAYARDQVAQSAQAEVLCLGDSRVKFALLPRVFRAASGREARNLAITAGRAPSSYYLLRHALEGGARPRAIVIDFDDKLLADEPLEPAAPPPWAELLTPRDAFELEQQAGAPGFAEHIIAEQVLYSLKNRHELRGIVTRLVRGKRLTSRLFHDQVARNWKANEGAQVNAKRTFRVPPQPSRPDGHVEGTWAPHPVNVRYVERLLALAHARGIPVYWLLTPRCPTVQDWRDWYGEEARYERFVRAMVDRFSNVTVVDARHSGYEADVFVDTVHLDRDGATTLSKDVAQAIEQSPASRWVQIPCYGEAVLNVAVEDLEESRAALIRRPNEPDSRLGGLPRLVR